MRPVVGEPFEAARLLVVTPSENEKMYIDEKIRTELQLGIVKPETKHGFLKIIGRMAQENSIGAVILACTELPMLFKDIHMPVACLDTMQLHIKALVEEIISV